MPDDITDRAADIWEALLAVADLAGGDWPERARRAAVELNRARLEGDGSLGARLLADVRDVFNARSTDTLLTADLLPALHAMVEEPWGDLRGRPLDDRGLARRLRPYGIRSHNVRPVVGVQGKGYARGDFADAWTRYTPGTVAAVPGNGTVPAKPLQDKGGDSWDAGTDDGGGDVPGTHAELVQAVLEVFPGSRVTTSHRAEPPLPEELPGPESDGLPVEWLFETQPGRAAP